MTKPSETMTVLRDHMLPDWTEARGQAVLDQIHRRQAQVKRQRIAVGGFAIAGAMAVALLLIQGRGITLSPSVATKTTAATGTKITATATHYPTAKTLLLADHSTVEVARGSDLTLVENTAKRVVIDLPRGGANFDVVPDASRSFVIRAGKLSVSVLGTMFEVRHRESDVLVAVSHGRVQVTHGDRAHFLAAGEAALFAHDGSVVPTAVAAQTAKAEVTIPEVQDEAHKDGHRAVDSSPSWRALTKAGEYEAAYDKLQTQRASLQVHDPAVLLDAADAARFSGHPAEAVRFLDDMMSRHRKNPMAPLAAFTLGRVCLEQLGQPQRAAEAFALAFTLAPYGSLAQDALAREVEALSKGGHEQEAFERAQEYLRRYPNGRRLRAVRMYGGLP